jgi:hypothetical protein
MFGDKESDVEEGESPVRTEEKPMENLTTEQ